ACVAGLQARAGRQAPDPRRRSGSPNRGPLKAKGEAVTGAIRVVSSGIDSLYVSFRREIDADRLEELEVLKARAQESGEPEAVDDGLERRALVQPSGWESYRGWMRGGEFG